MLASLVLGLEMLVGAAVILRVIGWEGAVRLSSPPLRHTAAACSTGASRGMKQDVRLEEGAQLWQAGGLQANTRAATAYNGATTQGLPRGRQRGPTWACA